MTGYLLLDWAVLAISFFDTILLLWLGLTVLLNAERRAWGIWLAAGGLLAGAAFLVIHSSLFAQGWVRVSVGLSLGWFVGWLLVVALPFTWYLMMLWYAGYWEAAQSPVRRQRPWLVGSALLAMGLLALLVFANPFPSYWRIVDYESAAIPALGPMPLVGLAYPLFILLCISLSVEVLLRPAPSGRLMGDLARRRARPWLVAASLVLLLVSGLVAWVVGWLLLSSHSLAGRAAQPRLALTVASFDLAIDALLAVAVLLLGQAMVSYEIFTGKTLPRRGLRRHWQSVIVLAAGFAVLVAGSLTREIRPVNGLLMTAGLVTLTFALLGHRSYVEREHYIEHLRPFVASLRLYEHLLTGAPADPPEADLAGLFHALCEDLLGARVACLAALGPAAPLAGPPLSYPHGAAPPALPLAEIASRFDSPKIICLPVEPAAHGGAAWAVPLWSQRGLIGLLLLGEKRDGGLYAQEEIEIARASGERLIDTLASAELARRLVALQRQRLAESQVLDQRARRVLHDDVLPRLHTALLGLAAAPAQPGDAAPDPAALLADAHRRISDLLRDMPAATAPELERLGLAGALRQVVEQELAGAFHRVTWEVDATAELRARALPPRLNEVLFYAGREAIRNAARHGRGDDPARPLRLHVALAWREGLCLVVEDGGVGLGAAGQGGGLGVAGQGDGAGGQGLALHSAMMAVIGGSLTVESRPGAYTRVALSLPQDIWP